MFTTPDPHPLPGGTDEGEDEEPVRLPIYLLPDHEMPHLLHPEILTVRHLSDPPETSGFECVFMHQEDYTETTKDEWQYVRLQHLETAVYEYDEDTPPEELARCRAEDAKEYMFPEKFPCPVCADGGDVEMFDDHEDGQQVYSCCNCCSLLCLELRPPIVNAAALLLLPADPVVE